MHPRCLKYLLTNFLFRPGLPKRFQTFLFFKIKKPEDFKLRLKSFVENGGITSAKDACDMRDKILAAKIKAQESGRPAKVQSLPGVNIAFASTGLAAVSHYLYLNKWEYR